MYIFWSLAGVIFLISDFKKANTLKLVFALSFLFCAAAVYRYNINIYFQPLIIAFLFPVFYYLVNTIFKKEKDDIEKVNSLDKFEGKSAYVVKDIGKSFSIDGFGLIEYNNRLWQAKNITDKEIKAGKTVEIVSRENMIMNVRVIENA